MQIQRNPERAGIGRQRRQPELLARAERRGQADTALGRGRDGGGHAGDLRPGQLRRPDQRVPGGNEEGEEPEG